VKGLAFAASLLVVSASNASLGCPCRASFGPGGSLTSSLQTWGVSATEAAQFVHGYWDANGDYFPIQGLQRRLDLFATGAYRVQRQFELSLSSVFGTSSRVAPGGFSADSTGIGDTVLRARWDVHEAPVPHQRSLLNPGVALIASIRVPTAKQTTTHQSHPGSHGSSLSDALGTWEGALAVDLSHAPHDDWRIGVLLEGALRAPDDSFGVSRWLGPRLMAQATLGYYLFRSLELGALAEIEWELDTQLAGSTASGTGRRAIDVGGFASFVPQDSGFRSGLQLRHAPSFDGLGVNAVATTQMGVSLGYVR
jgi:hypothetical protein